MFREEEMDVKTAVKILQYYGSDNAIDISDFIEQQEKYAGLGRLFAETVDKQHICKGKFNKWSCTAKCFMNDVCQLRTELLKVEGNKNA